MNRLHDAGTSWRCNRQAQSAQLPVDDLATFWSGLCDTVYAHLEGMLDNEVQDKSILPHVPDFLDRVAFEDAVQGTMPS